jgi:hypothetical protein
MASGTDMTSAGDMTLEVAREAARNIQAGLERDLDGIDNCESH